MMGPSKEIREGSARLLDAEAEIPEDRPRSQSLERVARNSESKRSDGEGGLSYQRSLDPLEANIYLDSLFGPLFYKLDRIRTEGKAAAGPRFSDYRLVSVFMLLNIFTQLSIAFKIYQVGDQTYGSIRDSLMGTTCWRVSRHPELIGLVYPRSWAGLHDPWDSDFDCTPPVLTLSIFPHSLDTNNDGFWSVEEVKDRQVLIESLGSTMAKEINNTMFNMAVYDEKNRDGSRSDFFKHYKGEIQVCVASDKSLCGNLAGSGQLHGMVEGAHNQERVDKCANIVETFCEKIFGTDYVWIHHQFQDICGQASFKRRDGVNIVSYAAVKTYRGAADSILGRVFITFLVLLVFVWVMLMISEYRMIYNFFYVVWNTRSTDDADPDFVALAGSKFTVMKLPIGHKIFALACIALPRVVIASVVLVVGCSFLAMTNNLLDLVLNSTALGFLIEVDDLIHHALLGKNFEIQVMRHFEEISVECQVHGASSSYAALIVSLLITGVFVTYTYLRPNGLQDVGYGVECLCHLEGNCYAQRLLRGV